MSRVFIGAVYSISSAYMMRYSRENEIIGMDVVEVCVLLEISKSELRNWMSKRLCKIQPHFFVLLTGSFLKEFNFLKMSSN